MHNVFRHITPASVTAISQGHVLILLMSRRVVCRRIPTAWVCEGTAHSVGRNTSATAPRRAGGRPGRYKPAPATARPCARSRPGSGPAAPGPARPGAPPNRPPVAVEGIDDPGDQRHARQNDQHDADCGRDRILHVFQHPDRAGHPLRPRGGSRGGPGRVDRGSGLPSTRWCGCGRCSCRSSFAAVPGRRA
jgi:hypothetical protein